MKSKIIIGLATLASLAIPSFAQQTYCRLDGDGDRQICTTQGYDANGNYYQRSFSQRVTNGYYGNAYEPGYYNGRYYDRDARNRRELEERERREHERHERREHRGDRDDYR
ncbi:hypothetical protein Acid345_1396 [Candidatus Koribacter versatilis Ellin345]|uniref:Uncharacterized protein n=1 Tax=Koribacter versatilis (strain Ellin345) TaxID=204669 RepID=Q1IRV2_KORVE|nr:hypothetical protein [Candidatus Koribacter versatilis]ABF40398.1 hypothetical protein Acid345_1396 [Candidatus Koribacter versatilis Ellin345]